MMDEQWKDISGYEGLYQISNKGRIKSLKKWDVNKRKFVDSEMIMNPSNNGHGYLIVGLRKGTKRKNHYVHRLVAIAFLKNSNGYQYVNHLDYDSMNNAVNNLQWCTQQENLLYSSEHMRHPRLNTHTNTGERYISKRNGRYRVIVSKKEYGSCSTLDEAVRKRNAILEKLDEINHQQ